MKQLSSVENFVEFRKLIVNEVKDDKPCLAICAGTGGLASGSNDIIRIIKRHIIEHNLNEKISLRITGCLGFCEMDPFIIVEPGLNLYPKLKMEDVPKIIEAAVEGRIIEEMLYREPGKEKQYYSQSEIPFFKNQTRTVLGNNQKLDPIRIFNYIKTGGYAALEKVISNPEPEWIIKEIIDSGLRGRGGGGFQTGLKWKFAKQSGKQGIQKFIICNADEGDPGAYMDRSILEGNPHSVIEGMIIAGLAIGATRGIIYVRTEYPLAIKHSIIAINQARDLGILGKNILGSGIDYDIEIIKGAGAFVCGEETALIQSIEGQMGQPKQRPPYPVNKGLWGFPTCINNVETLANIPVIINQGAKEYAKVGTPGNTGTKIFSLVGKIKNTGLVEVPLGTSIKDVVYKIGGGSSGKAKIKAIQTGGPSGGCIPESMFNIPIDYESLAKAGSIMGSGGMIVMDENTCMVDVARYFTNFLQEESCGKCSTCREGTKRMNEILTNITEGKGKKEDIDLLMELGPIIKDASMCGLGQTAANPLLATLRYFENEYIDHIEKKKCTAGVCKEIISSPCQYTCPIGTEACVYIALIAKGKYKEAVEVIKKDNPLPSVLARVCHHPCEIKCKAGEHGESIAIRNLKRFATDYALKKNIAKRVKPVKKEKNGKIAIIGSGPAGLTCGFYLSQKGYDVTIFEKQNVLGGMLTLGIPEYRLPRKIIQADIDYIKSAGMEIKTNMALGRNFHLNDLFGNGYKAVFIATGANVSLKLDIAGEDIKGVIPGMEALINFNLNKNFEIGKRVGIIGGGNSAVDAARSALRAETSESITTIDTARSALRTTKPESVTIFYRRSMSEIPAYKEEVEGAMEEDIKFEFLTAPVRIISEKGRLKACEFVRMELGEVDESGRRKPVPIKGSEFIVELDTLIVSISEKPEVSFLQKEELEITKWSTLSINSETLETNIKGVFAGGDIVTGPNSVVAAVSAGKIAAESIDQYVQEKEVKREYKITRPSMYVEPLLLSDTELEELLSAKRVEMPLLSPEKRKYNLIEVEQGYTEEQAKMEAMRCLRCELETQDGQKFLEKIKELAQ
ncbi:MAG: hydrogenase [Bacteroidetes bacterium]|nr:MAG: hydrogenase [Bacteroidota bacterium]